MARWEPDARERLVRAALDLFAEQGYDDTTVVQIAERAGLTKSTFFRYFPDKREVLAAGQDTLASSSPTASQRRRPRPRRWRRSPRASTPRREPFFPSGVTSGRRCANAQYAASTELPRPAKCSSASRAGHGYHRRRSRNEECQTQLRASPLNSESSP